MQFTASCNPKGQRHWVYQTLIQPSIDGNKDISVHHVPLSENLHRISPDYTRRLDMTLRDPYERRQLIDGEWIDRPAGDAMFKEYFIPEIHVRGDAIAETGLVPIRGFPIIVGHDPGPKNYSIHFEQRIPTKDPDRPIIWIIFDELNFVGLYKPYPVVVKEMIERMRFWMDHPTAGFNYVFRHVCDEAAFTTKNSNGSFDARDIQNYGREQGFPFKMLPAPKGADSQPQRVQMLIDMLLYETIFVSAGLSKTIDMLQGLPSKKPKDDEYDAFVGLRPQKSPHLHSLDSLTYPPWRYHVLPGRAQVGKVERPRVFWAGQGVRANIPGLQLPGAGVSSLPSGSP
jgi:hypothetical protein